MNFLRYLSVFLALTGIYGGHAMASSEAGQMLGYFSSFALSEGASYAFPDFTLYYKGQREGEFYPGSSTHRMGDILQFEAVQNDQKVAFSWSSGTGCIGPIFFEIGGKQFILSPYLPSEMSDGTAPNTYDDKKWYCYPSLEEKN